MRDIGYCATELSGVSMVLTGISNQLDAEKTDSLNKNSLRMALFAVASHLERIAEDLQEIQFKTIRS